MRNSNRLTMSRLNFRPSKTALGIAGLYIPTMMLSFGQGMVIPLVPTLAKSFGVSPGLASQIITANAVGKVASLIPGGILVDRFNPKWSLVLGPLMITLSAVAMFLAPVFWVVLAAQFLAGAGDSLWLIGREVTGLNLVHPDKRGRLMSGFMGISSVGLALGPLLGGILSDSFNYRVVFLAYAVLGMVVLAMSIMIKHPTGVRTERRPALFRVGQIKKIAPYYRTTYLVLLFATFCMMLYRMSLNSAIPLYVGSQLGYSSTQVGAVLGISGFFVLGMIIPAGFLMDKVGRKWATVPSAALPAAAFLILPFAHTMPQLYLLGAVLGIANGLALGSLATSTYDVIPEHSRGSFQAFRRTVGEMGSVAGPLMGGVIADVFEPGVAFFAYTPLLVVTTLLLAFVAKESLVKEKTKPG